MTKILSPHTMDYTLDSSFSGNDQILKVDALVRALSLQHGDVIKVKAHSFQLIDHYALYAGVDPDGKHWFIGALRQTGVSWISEDDVLEWANSAYISEVRHFSGHHHQRNDVVQRAVNQIGKPYDLFGRNCEHLANYAQHGVSYSKQVQIASTAGVVAGSAMMLASKNKGVQVAGGILAGAGLIALLIDAFGGFKNED
jgi:Lecithin retinol acyltransferase